MRKYILFLLFVIININLFSQDISKNLKVEQFILDNGLTVYLNEDNSSSSVLGAVIIKTGGKYDPPFATGTSHYLEHMMFKGTDIMGTINYEEEKIYLDSIAFMYDELAKIKDDDERKLIHQKINQLSLKAGEYAIPNEIDKILDNIGSTRVNAFTSDEIVAYFNQFPSNQIEKWMYIYSNRFINPVFRLFQSELETVFEEKNMYADDLVSTFIEKYYEQFYKNHPYGTQTILGSADHIKNPSLTNMKKMYDTYYVANNMALVLTGNFKTDEVKPLIGKYFSVWKSGEVPEFPVYNEEPFNGVEVIKQRITPINVGLMGFRTVPTNHEDVIPLEVCQALLNNSSSTGYFDKLNIDGKLLAAMCISDIRNDHGGIAILYVPKIIGQSLKKAGKIVHEEMLKLQAGDIEEDYFEAVKLGLIKDHERSLENSQNRAFMIAQLFTQNKTWDEIIDYPEKIRSVSINDIKRVSEKYLGKDYLLFQSKMGFPKKQKLDKPGFDPVIPKNAEARSEFAKKLEDMPEKNSEPEFIDFKKDFESIKINDNSVLYYLENEINDIFNLKIKFKAGNLTDNRYPVLAEYMSLIGTQKSDLSEFNEKLQKIGCTFYVTSTDNYFVININGFDQYFKESVGLVSELLQLPKADNSKLKVIRQMDNFSRKYEKSSPDALSDILINYGIYGDQSEYLTRLSKKEINKIGPEELLDLLSETLKVPYSAHYTGRVPQQEIASVLTENLTSVVQNNTGTFPRMRHLKDYQENTILFLNDPKALQSKINFYAKGEKNDAAERAVSMAFNQYFGSGMSSLVFQEIREFRSMAYSSYGFYTGGLTFSEPGYFRGFIGTQADKTIDAISIMDSLIRNMPVKENRIGTIKSSLMQSVNSNKPEWRNLTETVESLQIQGFKEDPRIIQYDTFEEIDFEKIINFYKNNIQSKPILITIVGNKKHIDMEELSKFGKIIEVNHSQILK